MSMLAQENESIHVSIQEFSGPLELLLSLIRQYRIDIYDIPLSDITQKYIKEVSSKEFICLAEESHFFAMISLLIFMKSRTLTSDPEENFETEGNEYVPKTSLVDILIEYQKFRFLSKKLDEHTDKDVIQRDEMLYEPLKHEKKIWSEHNPDLLLNSYIMLLKEKKQAKRILDVYEPITVQEKITLIIEKLKTKNEFDFEELFTAHNVMSLVCAVLALLELAKDQILVFFQNAKSHRIHVTKVVK